MFSPEHLKKLLTCAQKGNYEFVSSRANIEVRTGVSVEKGSMLFRRGVLTSAPVGPVMHSTILYRPYLFLLHGGMRCLEFGLPGDAFWTRRMFNAGVRAGFVDQVTIEQPLRPDQVHRQASHPVE